MKLYGFFRSSAAYRVRIALNLKGIDAEHVSVNLTAGEQAGPEFAAINPQMIVPALDDGDSRFIQSLAIMEYLEETHPEPPLLPADPVGRARVRGIALIIACEMHPLNNSGVLSYLTDSVGVDEDKKIIWYRRWIGRGFGAIEALLAGSPDTGQFCHGDAPGLADICLVPQVFNARRFDCPLGDYPNIERIDATCNDLAAFAAAAPGVQPDAE